MENQERFCLISETRKHACLLNSRDQIQSDRFVGAKRDDAAALQQ
jgi:hypothetical protein